MFDKNEVIKATMQLSRFFFLQFGNVARRRGLSVSQGNIPSDGRAANLYFSLQRRRRTVALAAVGSLRRREI